MKRYKINGEKQWEFEELGWDTQKDKLIGMIVAEEEGTVWLHLQKALEKEQT